jgi:chondroitin AC lyase
MRKIRIVLLMAGFFLATAAPSCFAADMDTLYARLRSEYIVHGNGSSAATYLSQQSANGAFSGVSSTTMGHLERILQMAVAYSTPGNAAFESEAMLKGALQGLTLWYQGNHYDAGWWFNDIGYQLRVGPIAVLLRPRLSQDLIGKMSVELRRPVSAATGENLMWYGQKILWSAVLNNSTTEMATAKKLVDETLVAGPGPAEGLKSDWSFFQHGPWLATLNYGFEYIRDMSFWMYHMRGLSFGFTPAQVKTFSAYFLDGIQWGIHKGYLDYTCTARYVVRGGWLDQRNGLARYIGFMKAADPSRAAEYDRFLASLQPGGPGSVSGNRHFWIGEYHSHRREGYFIGLKIASSRTDIPESLPPENIHGFYQGVGAMNLAVDGNEYYNIAPQWDWALIPGTTAPHKNPAPDPGNRKSVNTFAGGASDSTYGVVGYDMIWDGVTGRKSWFFFDDQFVALGRQYHPEPDFQEGRRAGGIRGRSGNPNGWRIANARQSQVDPP